MTASKAIASLERTVGKMWKKYGALLAAATLVASLSACLLDPKEPPVSTTPSPPIEFQDLTEKEHVLNNLVASYLQRDINEYRRILDLDYYQFFFSDGDVSKGLPSEGWDKTQDEGATTNLLNRSSSAPNRIISIDLSVQRSNLIWVELAADPPLTETWWSVTTNYSFTFKTANDISYITSGSPRTQFIVRNIGTDEDQQWRLVRWRDLADG